MKAIYSTKRGFLLQIVTLSILLFFSEISTAQNNALFEQGKQQYKAEKFQEAISNWMKILNQGEHSSALYFNLANAHYKLNNIGPSIYYYEKALQLAPNDSEIKNNLAFAQNATVDAIEPLPQTIFAKWDKEISGWLTFNGWAITAVTAAIFFTLLFLLYYFSIYSQRKRMYFIGSILSVLVLITAFSMAYRNYNQQLNDSPAIIFAESSDVKADPKMGSETSFVLHEGTKVQIIAKDDGWCRIQILDGKDGWVPETDLKQL